MATTYRVKRSAGERVPYSSRDCDGAWRRTEARADIMDELLSRLDWEADEAAMELVSSNMRLPMAFVEAR